MLMMFAAAASAASAHCLPGPPVSQSVGRAVVRQFVKATAQGEFDHARAMLLSGAPYVDYTTGKQTTAADTLEELAVASAPPAIAFLQGVSAGRTVAAKLRFGTGQASMDAITVFQLNGRCIAGIYAF